MGNIGLGGEEGLLIELIRPRPEPALVRGLASGVDWDRLFPMSIEQGMFNRVYLALRDMRLEVSPSIIGRYKWLYETNAAKMMLVDGAMSEIAGAFEENGLEVVFLKGAQLSRLYGDVSRSMGDIDVLVRPGDMEKSELVLRGLGWGYSDGVGRGRGYWFGFGHHLPLANDGRPLVDLHWRLFDRYSPLREDPDILWAGRLRKRLDGVGYSFLSPINLLTHVCLHLSVSGFFHTAPLRHLYDINTIVSAKGKFDWAGLVERCRLMGCSAFAYQPLLLASEVLGTTVPCPVLEELRSNSQKRHLLYVARHSSPGIFTDCSSDYLASDYLWELFLAKDAASLMNLAYRPLYSMLSRR